MFSIRARYKRAYHDLVGVGVVRADHFRYAAQDRRLPAKHFRFVEQIEHVADRENRLIMFRLEGRVGLGSHWSSACEK